MSSNSDTCNQYVPIMLLPGKVHSMMRDCWSATPKFPRASAWGLILTCLSSLYHNYLLTIRHSFNIGSPLIPSLIVSCLLVITWVLSPSHTCLRSSAHSRCPLCPLYPSQENQESTESFKKFPSHILCLLTFLNLPSTLESIWMSSHAPGELLTLSAPSFVTSLQAHRAPPVTWPKLIA